MSNFEEAHVLVVDDSSLNCRLIERLLKNFSCKVTAVDSGLRALQLLEVDGLKVDMIITDYCMSNMTGYELLKKIKESSNFKEIPVVIMSSENVLTHKNKCLEEGAKDFIMKPVTISDFKKLKVYMKKDVGGVEESGINKRKLQEPSDQSLSTPSILPQTSSLSSVSPSPSLSSTSPSPSLSSTSSFSAPSSPTSFDSKIKLLKRTCSWSQGGWSNLP